MGWLHDRIKSVVKEAANRTVEDWLKSDAFTNRVNEVHREQLAKMPMDRRLTRVGFIWAAAYRLWEAWKSPDRDWVRCKEMASVAVSEFLADEKCRFGDARYLWTREGAIEIADAYEIEHWEAA